MKEASKIVESELTRVFEHIMRMEHPSEYGYDVEPKEFRFARYLPSKKSTMWELALYDRIPEVWKPKRGRRAPQPSGSEDDEDDVTGLDTSQGGSPGKKTTRKKGKKVAKKSKGSSAKSSGKPGASRSRQPRPGKKPAKGRPGKKKGKGKGKARVSDDDTEEDAKFSGASSDEDSPVLDTNNSGDNSPEDFTSQIRQVSGDDSSEEEAAVQSFLGKVQPTGATHTRVTRASGSKPAKPRSQPFVEIPGPSKRQPSQPGPGPGPLSAQPHYMSPSSVANYPKERKRYLQTLSNHAEYLGLLDRATEQASIACDHYHIGREY